MLDGAELHGRGPWARHHQGAARGAGEGLLDADAGDAQVGVIDVHGDDLPCVGGADAQPPTGEHDYAVVVPPLARHAAAFRAGYSCLLWKDIGDNSASDNFGTFHDQEHCAGPGKGHGRLAN